MPTLQNTLQYLRLLLLPLALLPVAMGACQREVADTETKPSVKGAIFDSVPSSARIDPLITEASGIAGSKNVPGHLWVQEDGGNPTQLYLLKQDGTIGKTVFLAGTTNRDWEDMALINGQVYVGEIGDNNGVYSDCAFYRFPEPVLATDTVRNIETIRFRYADGPRDAEAFMVEATGAIYIITKRESASRIYKLTPPFATGMNTALFVGQLPYNGVVGAALSADGKEMIIKTYTSLFYYAVTAGESIETALQKTPAALPYQLEPQGEAVCFAADNKGFFTLSEKGFASEVKLYFYQRK